jgi:formamidopyrimidine-DNA glycosylase
MPEGHTLHRIARHHRGLLAGRVLHADSPQGRFAAGSALLDGHVLDDVEAYGKHLFYDVAGAGLLHVHLGLYGKFLDGPQPAPPTRGLVRLRLQTDDVWIELRGATTVEILEAPGRAAILARLGPDPLRPRARPDSFVERAAASRVSIAAILMDQSMIAGVGNVFRAELLFRAGIEPHRSGRDVGAGAITELWDDAVVQLRAGVRAGRIVTTRPADRSRPRGPAAVTDAQYVYRRAGLPCRICGTEVRHEVLAGRNLFWCPTCQR